MEEKKSDTLYTMIRKHSLEIFLFVVTLIAILKTIENKTRYTLSNCANDGVIVLDQQTGESWITDHYSQDNEKITYLKPVGYCGRQEDDFTYTPEEKRNYKNATFDTIIKRCF